MNNFMHTFGLQKQFYTEQEARLSFFGYLDGAKEYFAPGDYPLHIDKTAEKLRDGISTVDGIEMKLLTGIPENVAIRLSEILEENPAETKNVIIQTARFFDVNPEMNEFFERYDKVKGFNVAQFKALMNTKEFLHVFETNPTTLNALPVAALGIGTVSEFIDHFTPIEKQRMFKTMVLRHIPTSVRTPGSPFYDPKAKDIFDSADGFDATTVDGIANIQKATRISSVIIGARTEAEITALKTRFPDEVAIAQKSLRAHFGIVDPAAITPTDGMVADYLASARLLELKGHRPSSVSAGLMKTDLPPSYLNGALKLNVLNQSSLDVVQQHLDDMEDEKRKVRGSAGHSLEDFKGTTRRAIEREAQTMADVYHEMSGFQKLALGAVALYFVNRFRGISLGLGVVYFADKFLTKGQGVETILNLAKKGGNAIANKSVGASDPEQIAKNAEARADFLGEYQADNMEEEATGFGLMTRVPLADLAKSFKMYETGTDADWELNMDPRNSPAMLRVKEIAREEGWSRKYKQFFSDPGNMLQVADALSFVFFRLAMRDSDNARDADIVTAALRSSPTSNSKSTFEKLEDLGNDEAIISYVRLIEKGKEKAEGETKTLGEFLLEEQGI